MFAPGTLAISRKVNIGAGVETDDWYGVVKIFDFATPEKSASGLKEPFRDRSMWPPSSASARRQVPASPANHGYGRAFAAALRLKDLKLAQEAALASGATTAS